MKKRAELFFTFILLPLDAMLLLGAFLLAYQLRLIAAVSGEYSYILPFADYFKFTLLFLPIWLLIFAVAGLYNIKNPRGILDELPPIFLGVSTNIALVMIWSFLTRDLFFSRLVIIYAAAFSLLGVLLGRLIIRLLQRRLYSYQVGVRRLLIIGTGPTAQSLIKEIQAKKKLGYRVVKVIDHWGIDKIDQIIKKQPVDEILIADPAISQKAMEEVLEFCRSTQISFRYAANTFQIASARVEIDNWAGISIIHLKPTLLDGWWRFYKRFFDLIFATIILILVSPIMLLTAMAIKLESRGPILLLRYKPDGPPVKRVGQDSRLFNFYKFRSMRDNVHHLRYTALAKQNIRKDGPMVKIANDPRVTKTGRFIRRTSIDELPQLFNVIKGNMSLVGPRPHLPEEVEKYEQYQRTVFTVKPGITGLPQVSGRSDLPFSEEVRLDIYYIENWSPWLDIKILLRTIGAVVMKKEN
ncbi:MAG: UDP-phosphate glucose phosphotransferase [Candidatus Berkelbacteria bacterium Licking1014_2]|uniref:UDP-phosphate glucose phosphotransferase n=1 Tax=Candidatus Berkelbacteria bacterium Licking1014_2 TaxID=2017146 RepID=A0A554LUM1_9BACT|nr:MAG: UDP-phosphate glucose phosphotransferase [Candidatus Berkelbacteria bacterium Licking1014_2]